MTRNLKPYMDLDDVPVSVPVKADDGSIKTVIITKKAMDAYERVLNPKVPFFSRVRNFLTASNAAGRKFKAIKDAVLLFTPLGGKIETITDIITNIIKPKHIMENPTLKKTTPQPSTVKGIAIFVSLLALIGVHLDAVTLSTLITHLITGISLAVPAGISLFEMIRDEFA